MFVKICDLLAGHDCMVGGRKAPNNSLELNASQKGRLVHKYIIMNTYQLQHSPLCVGTYVEIYAGDHVGKPVKYQNDVGNRVEKPVKYQNSGNHLGKPVTCQKLCRKCSNVGKPVMYKDLCKDPCWKSSHMKGALYGPMMGTWSVLQK